MSTGLQDDVWALGVTCFYIYTGAYLFGIDMNISMFESYLEKPEAYLSSALASYNRMEVIGLLLGLLDPIPANRVLRQCPCVGARIMVPVPAQESCKYASIACQHINDICRLRVHSSDHLQYIVDNSVNLYYRTRSIVKGSDILLATICVMISIKLCGLTIYPFEVAILLNHKHTINSILETEIEVARAVDGVFSGGAHGCGSACGASNNLHPTPACQSGEAHGCASASLTPTCQVNG
jgi:hypothetical protein